MKLSCLLAFRPVIHHKQFRKVQSFIFSRRKHNISAEAKELKCPVKMSTLYVPGRYGAEMYQIVRPVFRSGDILRDLDDIKKSCHLRGIDIDLENIVDALQRLESERIEFASFVQKDQQYLEKIKHLHSIGDTTSLNTLKEEHEELINQLKSAKEKLHTTEESVLPIIQRIPNLIHVLTPLVSDSIVEHYQQHSQQYIDAPSHTDICNGNSLLKFFPNKSKSCYLKGALSELELAIQIYFCNKLIESGYGAISGVDFCKSFILEAVGRDPYSFEQAIPMKMKVERGQMLHLVGGASFESFCAYLTNMNVSKITLPMKYFSIGRLYDAENYGKMTLDLFSVVQSTDIQCLTLCENKQSENEEFEEMFNFISSCYKDFKIPFRVVNCSSRSLNIVENRCKRLEIWSPSRHMYIPVARTSGYGDFVSKRLHATYGIEHITEGYCHLVAGVAVNIPILIGCIVENFQKPKQTFRFPEELEFLQKLLED